jgi:nitroreductase
VYNKEMKNVNGRETEYPINDIFLKRYSPRAMSGEAVSKEELMTLCEAARWAPSSMNFQPWRFIYAMRDTPEFEMFLSFLFEGNRTWNVKASALVVVLSKNTRDDGSKSVTHSFDTGSAWENLALQATDMNLVTHGMGGIDYNIIKEKLSIPDEYSVEMMFSVGKHGKIEDLPEKMQEREKPNNRKSLEEIVSEGKFKK